MSAVLAILVAGVISWQLLGEFLLESRGINLERLQERMGLFSAAGAIPDESLLERARVAEKALELFEDNIVFGGGLGSTETWSESTSTHNMYLYFMADYGLIGVFVYPLLIYIVVVGRDRSAKPYAIAFGCFAAVWGLFSHNIVGELYSLLSFALVAAWVRSGVVANAKDV